MVEIWKRANADLEPSTKMLALLRLLKSWDATGDKTICFSQCWSQSRIRVIQLTQTWIRDFGFGSRGNVVREEWNPEPTVRRKDGQGIQGNRLGDV